MKNKKILIVISHENFRDEEALKPKNIFEINGYKVDIVSDEVGNAKGTFGSIINVKKSFEDINVDEYSAISITGGSGVKKYLLNNKSLFEVLQVFKINNKIIAAICISPIILAKANLLYNKKVTFYKEDELALKIMNKSRCIIINKNVVVDGNIVTADGPQSSEEYGQKIIDLLREKDQIVNFIK